MVRRNRNPPAEQKPEEKDDEERTELRGEYRGGKITLFIGKNNTMLAWGAFILMAAVAIAILAATIISVLEKVGQNK